MITNIIIGITILVSFLSFNDDSLMSKLKFNPYLVDKKNQYYRFITSGFIHINLFHLIFNMYALYLFGGIVENTLVDLFGIKGLVAYVVLYFSALIMSDTYFFYKHKDNPHYNSLGASGAVAGVLFASIIIQPLNGLMIFPIPLEIPAFIFGPLYLAYSHYMAKNGNDNIAHEAHFFGALWGVLFIIILWHDALRNFISQLPF